MARNRFVNPEIVRLPLSGGDWIEIKKDLNTGETQDMYGDMRGGRDDLDPARMAIARVVAYLLDWSFTKHGAAVPVTREAIRGLFPHDFGEIREAIDAHMSARDAEIETLKKTDTGGITSSAISASVA